MTSRFQFVPGAASSENSLQRWPAEWAAAMPAGLGWSFARQTSGTSNMPTAWRLVGSNNRELGRSSHVYPDLAACRAAVTFLQAHIDEAESLLATTNDTGLWLWRLNIGDQWMAAAGRSYQRRRECLYNVLRFVAAAPTAVLSSDVLGRSRGHDLHRATLEWPEMVPVHIDLTQPVSQSTRTSAPIPSP
jgi:hypothetical protein